MSRKARPTESRFGHVIRDRRESLGFSKEDLASTLGLSASFIDVLETGRRGCNLDDLPRIAAGLQLDARAVAKIYLAERHKIFYRAIFSEPPDAIVPLASMPAVEDMYWRLEKLARRERGIVEALVYLLYDLATKNRFNDKTGEI